MNKPRRLPFLIGIIIGVAIAILEFRGIASLVHEGGQRLRERFSNVASTEGAP